MITVNLPNGKLYTVKNFSASQLKQIKTCAKRWELMRVQYIPWKNNIYLVRGRNFHTVMEHMHLHMFENRNNLPDLEQLLEMSEEGLRADVTPDLIPIPKKRAKKDADYTDQEYKALKLQELIDTSAELIKQVYSNVDYEVSGVEISAPIIWHDLPFEARVDLVINRGGKNVLVDHKTKSVDDHAVDLTQYSTYLKCLREHKYPLEEAEQWDSIFTAKPVFKVVKLDMHEIENGIKLLDEDLANSFKLIQAGIFTRNEYHSTCKIDRCPVWDLCRNPDKIEEFRDDTPYHTEVTGLNIV